MSIESNQNTVHSRTAVVHASGKAGGSVTAPQGEDASKFAGVMGGLFVSDEPAEFGDSGTIALLSVPMDEKGVTPPLTAAVVPVASADSVNLVADMVAQVQGVAPPLRIAPAPVDVGGPVAALTPDANNLQVGEVLEQLGVSAVALISAGGVAQAPGLAVPTVIQGSANPAVPIVLSAGAGGTVTPMPMSQTNTPTQAQIQTGAQGEGGPTILNKSAKAVGAAPALQRDARLVPVPELLRPLQSEVPVLQAAVSSQLDALVPLSKSKPELSNLTGVGLGAGAQQIMDRLGLTWGQQVTQTSAVVADTQVAETVSYWVTQGVQKAEMTLDGFGDAPVEVHIELDGNQTRVDFRSDQPQVRQAIEAANAQLKSLLLSQGLQLSGMSVGSFGQGGQPSDGRSAKPAATRSVGLHMVENVAAGVSRVVESSMGRALDLYV